MTFDRLKAQPPAPKNGPRKWLEAPLYDPGAELETALNMAMALEQPLLITGEPGCGKTSAAYWAAWRMCLEPEDVIHETVRSDSSAARLKYEFDHVRYFRDAQVAAARVSADSMRAAMLNQPPPPVSVEVLDRSKYIQRGPLWRAFEPADPSAGHEDHGRDTVLLLDEIDKAPRDFPNDLLHELEEREFAVLETGRSVRAGARNKGKLALVVITSNGERRLPDAFLRRCVHHHIDMDQSRIAKIVYSRVTPPSGGLSKELVDFALERYHELRDGRELEHRPTLAELLVWTRLIELSDRKDELADEIKNNPLRELPYLGALLKDPRDRSNL
jgi:MoxR-like ATPase